MFSNHFDGRRFRNPTGISGQPLRAVLKMLREPRVPWPQRIDIAPRRPPALEDASAMVTHVGHATWLIQTPTGNVLTDPMYSERAGPFNRFGPRRVRPPAVRFEDLPQISTVLLSHNHYDHCDRPTLRRLARRFDPIVITPLGNGALVRSCGIRRIEELDWWERAETSPVPVVVTPAQHFSARTPFDRNRALWSGFFLPIDGARIFFAADTAYAPFFSDLRRRLAPIDLAVLPIGAYEPRWFMHVVHMNPAEAVRAHLDLDAAVSVGTHYGTFHLTAEAIDDPVRKLADARAAHGVDASAFRVLDFGESIRLGSAAL